MKKSRFLFLPVLLFSFFSCLEAQEILGVPRKEAAERFKNGDVSFILEAELPEEIPAALKRLEALSRIHPEACFYAGLLTESIKAEQYSGNGNTAHKNLLFVLALKSSSPPVRREAASRLILPCLKTEESSFVEEVLARLGNTEAGPALSLRGACLYRLGRFEDLAKIYEPGRFQNVKSADGNERPAQSGGVSSWDIIIPLLAALHNAEETQSSGEKTVRDTKNFFFDKPVDSVWEWAMSEISRLKPDFFSSTETSLLSGREAVARYSYGEGLLFFRKALEDASPRTRENYFFTYPELVSDLGRAFQFAPGAQAEGAAFFTEWNEAARDSSVPEFEDSRYRIPYFAGRIERQRGEYEASNRFFREALEAAPDAAQADACVWYILTNALTFNPAGASEIVKEFIPKMSSPPYFADVTDRLSRYLTNAGQWETMLEIYELLKNGRHGAASQYAWILGRAEEEGLFKTEKPPEEFFKAAFEEENAAIYYRVMSAAKLKIPFPSTERAGGEKDSAEKKSSARQDRSSEAAQEARFILDFFELGCGNLVLPFLKNAEKKLPFPELRKAAEALAEQGDRDESLNLAARYMARGDYELENGDLLLYYPRHFRELIEKNAGEAGVRPELLFGLVRTESAFMSGAVSRSGAVGLGQLIHSTALDMADRISRRGGRDYRNGGEVDLRDPQINVHLSAYYLRYLIDLMGSPATALLAYNGGLGRIRRWKAAGPALPDDLFLETIEFTETREYGRWVLAAAVMYGRLYYGVSAEAVIADIYR